MCCGAAGSVCVSNVCVVVLQGVSVSLMCVLCAAGSECVSNVCVCGAAGSVCVSNVCCGAAGSVCVSKCVCCGAAGSVCVQRLDSAAVRTYSADLCQVSLSLHDACTQQMVQMSYYWTNFK